MKHSNGSPELGDGGEKELWYELCDYECPKREGQAPEICLQG